MPAAIIPSLMYSLASHYADLPMRDVMSADDTVELPALDDELFNGIMDMLKAVPVESEAFVGSHGIIVGLIMYRKVRVQALRWDDDNVDLRSLEIEQTLADIRARMLRLEEAWNHNVTITVCGPKVGGVDVIFHIPGTEPPEPHVITSVHPDMM